MDLNMKSILIGLEENKRDYSDTEVEMSFSKEDAKVLTKKTRMINLTPLKQFFFNKKHHKEVKRQATKW